MSDFRIPKGERLWVSYYNKKGELLFSLTSKELSRDWYYLYRIEDGKQTKLGRARTPAELEQKYKVNETICEEGGTQKRKRRTKTADDSL